MKRDGCTEHDQAAWREEHDRNCKDLFFALRNSRLAMLHELHGCIEQMNRLSLIQFGRNHSRYDRAADLVYDLWQELEAI